MCDAHEVGDVPPLSSRADDGRGWRRGQGLLRSSSSCCVVCVAVFVNILFTVFVTVPIFSFSLKSSAYLQVRHMLSTPEIYSRLAGSPSREAQVMRVKHSGRQIVPDNGGDGPHTPERYVWAFLQRSRSQCEQAARVLHTCSGMAHEPQHAHTAPPL